eukprot:8444296-Pyramimonas_sp.AAC.1
MTEERGGFTTSPPSPSWGGRRAGGCGRPRPGTAPRATPWAAAAGRLADGELWAPAARGAGCPGALEAAR